MKYNVELYEFLDTFLNNLRKNMHGKRRKKQEDKGQKKANLEGKRYVEER